MKDLRIKFSVILEDYSDDKSSTTVGHSLHNRVISGTLREMLSHESLLGIVDQEIKKGSDLISKDLLSQIKIPLTENIYEVMRKMEKEIAILIPHLRIPLYYVESKILITNVYLNPYPPELPFDVPHPKCSGILTTVYPGHFGKLKNGSWAMQCQGSVFYEDFIFYVPNLFDESIIEKYFKEKGLEYEIALHPTQPIPM